MSTRNTSAKLFRILSTLQALASAANGVSNSGKTYTFLGEQSAGIVPRALSQIFSEYQNGIAQYPCIRVHNDQIEPLNDDEVEFAQHSINKLIEECRKKKIHNNWADDFEAKTLENLQ
jgi:Kinesin motor domain